MALFTEAYVRQQAKIETAKPGLIKKAESIILEENASYKPSNTYDIFLSHSIKDADLILGMKKILEGLGYSIYVDWIEDNHLDRAKVNAATADKLRERMNSCSTLFFITTTNSIKSLWMPWECGYFDGKKEKVAIVPIEVNSSSNSYAGQEYLGLYPYITKSLNTKNIERIWVRQSASKYVWYDTWSKTPNSKIQWQTE